MTRLTQGCGNVRKVLISCEKCSTTYVLDDGMIPPQGAPVQCTRCGFVFTAKPGAPSPNDAQARTKPQSNQTMPFGALDHQPAAAASTKNQTMVFGAVPPAKPANQTMAFGALPSVPAKAPDEVKLNQTIAFGKPAVKGPQAAQPKPPPTAEGAGSLNRTLVFGAKAVTPKSGQQSSPTEEVLSPLHGASSDRTVRVDVSELKFSSETPVPEAANRNRTVLFAGSDSQATLDSDSEAPPDRQRTEGWNSTDATVPQAFPLDGMASGLEGSSLETGGVDLPPDPEFSRGPALSPANDSHEQSLAAAGLSTKRSRVWLWVLLGLIALALVAGLLWKVVGEKLLSSAVPFETQQQFESSLALLRLDDSASKQSAIDALTALAAKNPGYTEAAAALVLARSLQYDDLQQRAARLKARDAVLTARLAVSESTGAASETPTAQVNALRSEYNLLLPELQQAKSRLEAAVVALEHHAAAEKSKDGAQWVLKSSAVAKGVFADAEALALSQRFRSQAGGSPLDTWLELAEPEYYANAQSSTEAREEARAQLTRLRSQASNSTLLRTYVLEARLRLKDGSLDEAEEALSQVVTMRSNHDVAQELLAWVQAEQKAQEQ